LTPSLLRISAAIADTLDITPASIRRRLQTPRVVLGRHVLMYIARAELNMTYEEIGREMRRHNSSVLHGINRVATLIRQGDERTLRAVAAGEQAAVMWRKLTPIAAMRERREKLLERAREMREEAARIGTELNEELAQLRAMGGG
jgi:hypothetical protein